MKLLEINSVPYGSTGTVARNITNSSKKIGESYFAYSWTKRRKAKTLKDEILIGSFLEKLVCIQLERVFGNAGHFSFLGTIKLIKKMKRINPDIVHLHNLHEGYINYRLLFSYLKKSNINVVWTLHDCWAFTGHCPHFEAANCYKWKTRCYKCPVYKEYPKSLFDNSQKMYNYKKKWFTCLDSDKLTIVTPSNWLASYVKQSFLKKYRVLTINNGVKLDDFKPIESEFREQYNCDNKFIILGVAMDWGYRKGLDIFIKLAKDLDERFQIVLVGTNDEIDKGLPDSIISIHRTENVKELAKIYSASDLFVNPTREDNFPTVNIEALSCGLPVLTFETGGSPEIIDSKCGEVVPKNDYTALKNAIERLYIKNFDKNDCVKRGGNYNSVKKYDEYVSLFKEIANK